MSKWSLRYASEMDEETLNRLIPTTSIRHKRNPELQASGLPHHYYTTHWHYLDKPVGNLDHIVTSIDTIGNDPEAIFPRASMWEDKSIKRSVDHYTTKWEDQANEELYKHFVEKPIDLPNKVDVHHHDNHLHILHRVKKWVADQV